MTVYELKQIHWNSKGYVQPAGHKASSGYPKDWGFGHEEWNGSPKMRFQHEGRWYRAFHTESNSESAQNLPGETTVFMYASHHGVQDLVGVAGQATDIRGVGEAVALLRAKIRHQIGTQKFWSDAWAVPLVRERFESQDALREHWEREIAYGPTWICPEEQFLWLQSPVRLDATAITGKAKLQTRFRAKTVIGSQQAATVLDSVPLAQRNVAWNRIRQEIDHPASLNDESERTIKEDLDEIVASKGLSATMKRALVDARLGQGRFRRELMSHWKNRCAVTGCAVSEVLRASHIKPWKIASNEERLDQANGLLLAAHLDALFDRHLITFEDDGRMRVAAAIDPADQKLLGLGKPLLQRLDANQCKYLTQHRQMFAGKFRA